MLWRKQSLKNQARRFHQTQLSNDAVRSSLLGPAEDLIWIHC